MIIDFLKGYIFCLIESIFLFYLWNNLLPCKIKKARMVIIGLIIIIHSIFVLFILGL